jgi:hypothetical protein
LAENKEARRDVIKKISSSIKTKVAEDQLEKIPELGNASVLPPASAGPDTDISEASENLYMAEKQQAGESQDRQTC